MFRVDYILKKVLALYMQIGKPEVWERAPDPKKYFVEFFGTGEM